VTWSSRFIRLVRDQQDDFWVKDGVARGDGVLLRGVVMDELAGGQAEARLTREAAEALHCLRGPASQAK
jgi:hypothetical protein